MTVNLTRIYTKLGDTGETDLGDMSRVSKLHPRVEAYGTVDELNADVGLALLQPDLPERFAEWLRAGPERPARRRRRPVGARRRADAGSDPRPRLRVDGRLHRLARAGLRRGQRDAAPLRSFVIPGGTPAAAQLHVCRTVCRRAERRAIAVGEDGNPEVVRYLNRLSDLLFILSRAANAARRTGERSSRCGSRARTAPAPGGGSQRTELAAGRRDGQRRSAARSAATASAVHSVAIR